MTLAVHVQATEADAVTRKGDVPLSMALALLAFAALAFAPQILNDGDTFWHIRAGEWMLDHRAVLTFDPFSYTFAGKPWTTHEWLAEIIFALAFRAAGWSGVMALTAAAFAATAGFLGYHLSRFLPRGATLIAVVLALAAMAGSLLARPHLLALPLLEIWTASLVIARSENRAPSFALLPVMALWANLHASFAAGLGLIAVFGVEAVIATDKDRVAVARAWVLFGVGAIAAACLTPHGANGLLFPFTLQAMPSLAFIGEWQPTDLKQLQPFELGLAFALYILVTRRVRLSFVRAALLLGLTYLAFAHARHQMLLALIAPLVLAEPVGAALGEPERTGLPVPTSEAAAAWTVLALALLAARFDIPVTRTDSATAPITALAHVPPALRNQPVFNDYAFGGYLIFGDVKPFIDSRAELYGNGYLESYARDVSDPKTMEHTLERNHIRWTILAPSERAAHALDAMKGWKRVYADRWAVVDEQTRLSSPAERTK
jgi:hypothetical protein